MIKHLKQHSYYYFLGIATAYLIFYSLYILYEPVYQSLCNFDKLIEYLSQVSILFFTAGIFSASLKYLQFLGVFETEFKKAINSTDFDKKLEAQLKQITFSEEFLLDQSNLPELWETVTLCKYRKQFPAIYPKLKKKINNQLFTENNISYFYKNFQNNYNISLIDGKYAKIIERTSLTIVRPNEEPFEWDCKVFYTDTEDQNIKADISFNILNSRDFKQNKNDITEGKDDGFASKEIKITLSGQLEYHIEREIMLVQDIEIDRVFAFGSDRIIDDLSLKIEHSEDLNVIFETVNGNKMYPNRASNDNEISYINRDIFLPGEKYKLFIIRK